MSYIVISSKSNSTQNSPTHQQQELATRLAASAYANGKNSITATGPGSSFVTIIGAGGAHPITVTYIGTTVTVVPQVAQVAQVVPGFVVNNPTVIYPTSSTFASARVYNNGGVSFLPFKR